MQAQLFITSTDPEWTSLSDWPSHRMFHVEHGRIKQTLKCA
jgi:hypothetical protein